MYMMLRTALAAVLLLAGPVAADTVLHMTSEPGDYIGQGNDYTLTPDTHTLNANRNYDNGVSFYLTAAGANFWHVDFAAPDEAELTAGAYANATRWPFQAVGVPGLSVSGQGRGCNQLTGYFEVLEVVYDASGQVLQFAADFEQHCEGAEPALTGQIRFNSDIPISSEEPGNEPPVAEPVLLAGLSATASTTYYPSYYSANNVLDDNPSSFWVGGYQQPSWWLTLNLGGMRTLDTIEMDWYYVYGSNNFDIEYSTDGVIFLPLHTGLSEPGTSSYPYVSTQVQSLDQIEASHVRLVIHQAVQSFPVLSEIRVFGWMPDL
jgi:hypothetical protein